MKNKLVSHNNISTSSCSSSIKWEKFLRFPTQSQWNLLTISFSPQLEQYDRKQLRKYFHINFVPFSSLLFLNWLCFKMNAWMMAHNTQVRLRSWITYTILQLFEISFSCFHISKFQLVKSFVFIKLVSLQFLKSFTTLETKLKFISGIYDTVQRLRLYITAFIDTDNNIVSHRISDISIAALHLWNGAIY